MSVEKELQRYFKVMLVNQNPEYENVEVEFDTSEIEKIALNEIIRAIRDKDLSDYDVVEKIVNLFEKYNIDCNERHKKG